MIEVQLQRQAILAADLKPISFGGQPNAANLYIPPSHLKALKLETSVVIGGRGVGKSFWAAALSSEELRSLVGLALPEFQALQVSIGFSEKSKAEYPDADTFKSLLNDTQLDTYDIWRAVIVRWVARLLDTPEAVPATDWQATIAWVQNEPELVKDLMLKARTNKGLIVFDALDRSSDNWQAMDNLVRGLLRSLLWLKSFSGLYGKVFLREDQAERTVFDFPDASKLKATQAELTWAKHDLHGLLWQRLINAPDNHGEILRNVLVQLESHPQYEKNIWMLPEAMKRETSVQRKAFEQLAGPWMGKDRRRGVPYIWTVSHLADCRGLASPRSFLAAMEKAIEDSAGRDLEHRYALHYESIKRGIQEASKIRVDEVAEDYPWVKSVLEALEGLNVPIEFSEIKARWQEKFTGGVASIDNQQQLPAQHEKQSWEGVQEDLQRLGMLETKKDNRVDMPDLYRVGFKLGRKGGIRPVK